MPWIALQSGVKNWQPIGSRRHFDPIVLRAMKTIAPLFSAPSRLLSLLLSLNQRIKKQLPTPSC